MPCVRKLNSIVFPIPLKGFFLSLRRPPSRSVYAFFFALLVLAALQQPLKNIEIQGGKEWHSRSWGSEQRLHQCLAGTKTREGKGTLVGSTWMHM